MFFCQAGINLLRKIGVRKRKASYKKKGKQRLYVLSTHFLAVEGLEGARVWNGGERANAGAALCLAQKRENQKSEKSDSTAHWRIKLLGEWKGN